MEKPCPLEPGHQVENFDCGEAALKRELER